MTRRLDPLDDKSRRRLFARLLTGTAVAAVAATGVVSRREAAATEGQRPVARGYRETEHIRRYYRTASF